MNLSRIYNLADFETAARRHLPAALYGFIANGAEDGVTVRGNRDAYEARWLIPEGLVDVSTIDTSCEIFGQRFSAPFGIAPMGGAALYRHQADLTLAVAAHRENVPFILSAASSVPLERIAREAPGSWYQSYLPGDDARIDVLLKRLQAAQVPVLVVTIDVPIAANRDADRRSGFRIPLQITPKLVLDGLLHPRWLLGTMFRTLLSDGVPHLVNGGAAGQSMSILSQPTPQMRSGRERFNWQYLAYIRRHWKGPLLVKGVLSREIAARAVREGVDGLIVSNHGGRQLDGAIPSLEALEGICDAASSVPVCLDGGVRRGSDIVKAMALGAKMVFAGRPFLYATSVAGEAGVTHAIELLNSELNTAMALLGCLSTKALAPSHVVDGRLPRRSAREGQPSLSSQETDARTETPNLTFEV